jgi:hypothetical protein
MHLSKKFSPHPKDTQQYPPPVTKALIYQLTVPPKPTRTPDEEISMLLVELKTSPMSIVASGLLPKHNAYIRARQRAHTAGVNRAKLSSG